MERRRSPPKHRHDGTSPLPLGMDWSPPPKKWNGRDTVWPHDPRTGWSYCITIPTWVVLPKSKDSDPVVFYRVVVGLQSPEGVTTTRAVLRRFNDFLRLLAALRKAFPQKNLPPAPPKGLLRLKSRTLLEERRCSLEEWMTKLLSDIDISRSIVVASFLELESAARSSFQDENPQTVQGNRSVSNSIESMASGSTPISPDYGSDTAYETSEIGTSSLGRDNISEAGTEELSLDEDLTGPLEKLVKHDDNIITSSDINLVLPLGQQQKINRVLISMQRRLGTAKTDMEDVISRLNQETAVKDYLMTKVKDLEEELETTKLRSKENLHQAIQMERERVTQMQWDMEELRRKSLEMEFKLKSQQDDKRETEAPKKTSVIEEKDKLLEELDETKNKFDQLLKKHQELEVKSKADIKVLVKEVKSLRNSQADLKQQLNQSLVGKSEAEKLLQEEKQKFEKEEIGRVNLLHEFDVLQHRLRECSINLLNESEDKLVIDSPSMQDALELIKISDDHIEALLAQVQIIAQDDASTAAGDMNDEEGGRTSSHKLRQMLSEILVDNINLRRQVSMLIHRALSTGIVTTEDKKLDTR
ncbi:putative PX domain-containing protein EREX [Helianthus debilis subsp. tardiflorus]